MGNYRYLTLEEETTAIRIKEILDKINAAWFSHCLTIEVDSEDDELCHIFWLHNDEYFWSFQIWLDKENSKKIIYHPNIQSIDTGVIEEFIAIKLREVLGGTLTYDY